jgi:hypothetical protein
MKRILTLFLIVSTLSVQRMSGQQYHHLRNEDARTEFQFGVKTGINLSVIYDEEGNQILPDPKFGFVAGAWLGIPLSKYLGLQPEVLYSQKGYLARGTVLNLDYSYTQSTDYLDLPLHLQFKPSSAVTLLAGPQYSKLISRTDEFGQGTITTVQKQEISHNTIRPDVWSISTGADFTREHLVISIRACFDLEPNGGGGTSIDPSYKNAWIESSIGYRF